MIYYEQDNNYKLQIEELNRLLETRQKTNECLNLKKFFSVDYSNVSNPFLIESFNVFIAALKELLSPANEIIINHTNNVKLFYCAQILKKLFEFLEMKVVITDITAPAEFISLKIKNSKFEICSQPLLDSEKNRKKVVEISDKNYYWNIKQNTWCESIFKFSLGLLYSFDETYNKELIVYDLEATGLTPADEITEIGAVKIKNGVILKKFQTLVNPKKNIPRDIQLLTNITNDMVRSAPDIKQAMQMFIDFAGADIKYIVVHNGSFDIAAVRYRLKKYFNINFSPKIYDTRQLSQSVKPGTGLDLSSLSLDFDVNLTNAHRALADAEATSQIFIKLVFLRNVKISIFFKDNISLFLGLGLLENNITHDFRIIMRAAAHRRNKFLRKLQIKFPISSDEYYFLLKLFENLDRKKIELLFEDKTELKINNNQIEIAEDYFDWNNIINLDLSEITKNIAYICSDCFPFDNCNNKIPVFCSGVLSDIKIVGNKLICVENNRTMKIIISNNNFKFFENKKLYYTLKFERYGILNLFNRIILIPLKMK